MSVWEGMCTLSYLIWRAVHSAELFKVLFNSHLNALIGLSVFQPLLLHQLIEEWLESCQKIISECFNNQIWARCECLNGSHPDVFKQCVWENLHWLVNNSLQRWLSSLGDVLTTKGITQMTALHKTPTDVNTGFNASGVKSTYFFISVAFHCIIRFRLFVLSKDVFREHCFKLIFIVINWIFFINPQHFRRKMWFDCIV